MRRSLLPASVLGVCLAVGVSPAQAFIYGDNTLEFDTGDVGSSFDVEWLVPAGFVSALPIDLSAEATFTLKSYSGDTFELEVDIENTTATTYDDGGTLSSTQANILSFGFGVDPDATSVAISGGSFFTTAEVQTGPQNFPGGFKDIDVCVYTAGCSGGDVNTGLVAGGTDTITLAVTGNFNGGTVMLGDFPLKFQGQWGSFEPGGGVCEPGGDCEPPVPPNSVAEPETLGLFALAGMVLATVRRRRELRA